MSDLLEKICKFQWVYVIIIIAFSIECYYEKEIMKTFILTFKPDMLCLIVISG